MKDIPKHFVANNDKVGNCNFDLVKKDGAVYMYHRTNMDGSHRSYEVFHSKFVAKGTPLPGGAVEKEDRMQYPGSAAFGRTAFDCKSLDHAEQRFDELVKRAKSSKANADTDDTNKVKRGRGRKRMSLELVLPPTGQRFTKKQLMNTLNKSVNPSVVYNRIQELVRAGKVVEDGTFREEGQRGKAQVIYRVL